MERWLSLDRTVDFVQTVTGSSLGPACQTLISICESGDVHARWTDYFGDHGITRCPPIHKRDWIGADIDWSTFRVVKADGARMAGVDFRVNDLHAWADARAEAAALHVRDLAQLAAIEAPAVPAPSPIKESHSRDKRDRAGEAIAAVWQGNIPARSVLPNSKFCGRVREWLKTDCKRRGVEYIELSNDTILRSELVPPDRRRKEK
jgi:hypothetical protein